MVDGYRTRWVIEEFNAALKTGCAYEARQFESRDALLTMLALSLPVACEVLWLRSPGAYDAGGSGDGSTDRSPSRGPACARADAPAEAPHDAGRIARRRRARGPPQAQRASRLEAAATRDDETPRLRGRVGRRPGTPGS